MATWRDHPYFSTVHVWLDAPTVIFRARVNQASFTYPAVVVLFDTVTTGAYTDIEVGMTVLFGSTAGADDLGRTYVKRPAGFNGFEFGRSEQGDHDGEVNLADNAYITILDDYRVWAKVPSISSGSGVRQTDGYRDFATYGALPPMIVFDCGTAVQADINPATNKSTFSFDASDSYPAEPGASISSYAYTLPATAIVTSGATNTSTVTFTTSQGVRWLKLDVTDSNGTVSTRHVRLIAETEGNLTGWELQPWEYGDDGQTVTLRLHGPAARATYPEGTGLYIWHKENYAGVEGSLAGPVGSEHMLFTGWLDTEAAATTPGERGVLSETTLKGIDVAGRLKQLMVVPINTGNEDDANSWDEMVDANIDKLMVRTLHEYSSALTLCDFRWSGTGASYPFTRWDTSGGTLWDALRGYAKAMGGKYVLTFDEWGRMAVPVDPMLVDSGSRTATVLAALGEGDWAGSLKAGRDRAARYRFMWGKSTVPSSGQASSTKTIPSANAVAPGLSGGPGPTDTILSGFLATSTELVTLLKHAYERAASPDELYAIDLAHGGNIGISPAAKAWVTVTQSAASAAQRGWTLATARMLPVKVRVSYDGEHGLMTRSLTCEKETVGVAAVAFTPKQRIEYNVPHVTPPEINYGAAVPPEPTPDLTGVTERMAAICDNGLGKTENFGDGDLTAYIYANWASLGVDGTFILWVPDGFSTVGGGAASGWIVTSTDIYYGDLLTATFASEFTFDDETLYRSADASFSEQGFFACASYYEGVGVTYVGTLNNFSTLVSGGEYTVAAFWQVGAAPLPGCTIDSRPGQEGKVYISVFTETTSDSDGSVLVSASHGASGSWSALSPDLDPDIVLAQQIFIPYGVPSDLVIFYCRGNAPSSSTTSSKLWRLQNGTLTDVAPNDGTYSYAPFGSRNVLSSPPSNPQRVLGALISATGAAGWKLLLSDNALDAVPTWMVLQDNTAIRGVAVSGGINPDLFFLWGASGVIAVTPDAGVTIVSQAGNLPTFTPGTVQALAGF